MTQTWPNAALVLVAHGSHRQAAASQLIRDHAKAIREANLFASVTSGFWHGEPTLSDVLSLVDQDTAYVVPIFKSEGHFTREIIPREMRLTGDTTVRTEGLGPQRIYLCSPVGSHAEIPALVEKLAAGACATAEFSQGNTSVLVVGHGGRVSSGSEQATTRVVETLSGKSGFGSVHALYLEQAPLIDSWHQVVRHPDVVAVPFLIGGGGHENEIAQRIGLPPGSNAGTVNARRLTITGAVGEQGDLARMIIDQVAAHPASKVPGHSNSI